MRTRLAAASVGTTLLLGGSLLAACGGSGPVAVRSTTTPAIGPRDAAQLFAGACASCHGPAGEGGWSGVPLDVAAFDQRRIADVIRHGAGAMPAAADGMTDEEVDVLVEHVVALRQ